MASWEISTRRQSILLQPYGSWVRTAKAQLKLLHPLSGRTGISSPETDVNDQGQSVAGAAATAAFSAQSVVPSAISTVDSALDAIRPRNCSLGIKYLCLGFSDHIDCKDPSTNPSTIVPIAQFPSTDTVHQALLSVTSRGLEGPLNAGLVFATLALLLGLLMLCPCGVGIYHYYRLCGWQLL